MGLLTDLLGDGNGASRLTKVVRAAVQSVAHNTPTIISFDTETFDDLGIFVIGTPTRVTIAETGRYRVTASGGWASNSTGLRVIEILLNGTTIVRKDLRVANGGADVGAITDILTLTAGDYLQLQGFQNSGVALNTATTAASGNPMTLIVENV